MRSAAQLIRRKGVSGTGMREIVTEADAPRGSLQHYFPGGKEELVSDALLWTGDVAARRVSDVSASWSRERRAPCWPPSSTPGDVISPTSSSRPGAPWLLPQRTRQPPASQLRQVLRRAFDGWLEPLSESLVELGVPPSVPTISPS